MQTPSKSLHGSCQKISRKPHDCRIGKNRRGALLMRLPSIKNGIRLIERIPITAANTFSSKLSGGNKDTSMGNLIHNRFNKMDQIKRSWLPISLSALERAFLCHCAAVFFSNFRLNSKYRPLYYIVAQVLNYVSLNANHPWRLHLSRVM